MPRPFISAYTPSNTEAALLQRIFVQRHLLLQQIVNKIEHSIKSGDKYHILLVGPRGSGKTHLLTLAYHKLNEKAILDTALRDNMRVAWLGEDATFTDLVDIALAMADALSAKYPDEFRQNYRQLARGYQSNEAALIILNALHHDLGQRTILLITENMDRTFSNMGDMGQKTWRAFMQEHPCITTLASAQQLVEAVSSRDQPFFGFYGIEHLAPLSAEDAQKLISNIASEQGNTELSQYLADPIAKYRIRALHYLAGGNHRMYVLLSELLSQASLDNLVAAFESLADELTPYFQERVRALPAQQAKIIEYLCSIPAAANVKTIAEDTFIAEASCSKQLSELSRKKYVRASKNGKETFYEMTEPLMRLCLDIKNQHGNPLKLITQFIRAWFSNADLEKQMGLLRNPRALEYCVAAMQAEPLYTLPIKTELTRLIEQNFQHGDYEQAKQLIPELGVHHPNEAHQAELKLKIAEASKTIAQANSTAAQTAEALCLRGLYYAQQGNIDAAMADLSAAIGSPYAPAKLIAKITYLRGLCYAEQGNIDAAMADSSAAIGSPDAPADLIAEAFCLRGLCYAQQGNIDAAMADYSAVIGSPDASAEANSAALFSTVEAMVTTAPLAEVIAAQKRAFAEAGKDTSSYGGRPDDLLKMVLQLGSVQWPVYIRGLLPLYIEYGQLDSLATGLVKSIGTLATMDLSHSQLDAWYQTWFDAAGTIEDLSLALRAVKAAIESIKTKNSRPLLQGLPLEIRQLVQPMLSHLWAEH